MKYFDMASSRKALLAALVLLLLFQPGLAQESTRSGMLDHHAQSFGLSTGINYAILPLQLHYRRGLNCFQLPYPVQLGVELAIPTFGFDLRDKRIKLSTEALIFKKSKFEVRGGIDPQLVSIRMATQNMHAIGTDIHAFVGLTGPKWNFGAECVYDQAFTTYIRHADLYRDNVHQDAHDGWYRWTASNFRAGIAVNRTLHRTNLFVQGGLSKTGTLKNYLFVPNMYFLLGASVRR